LGETGEKLFCFGLHQFVNPVALARKRFPDARFCKSFTYPAAEGSAFRPGPLAYFRCQPGELSLCFRGLQCRSRPVNFYFFGGAMLSFAALATRNLTTVLALILIVSPV
jgi:hypothetical protein